MRISILFFSIIVFGFSACTIEKHVSPNFENRIVLATEESQCLLTKEYGVYSFLFGLYPITNRTISEIPAGSTLRIHDKTKWYDYLVTALGGWAITLTRKSRTEEVCEEGIFISKINPREEQTFESQLQKIALSHRVIVYLKDKQHYPGKILGFSESSIFTELSMPEESGEKLDIAFLKDGTTKEGILESQDDLSVTLRINNQSEQILKSNLIKLSLNTVRQIKVKREIPKSEIFKIMFEESFQ